MARHYDRAMKRLVSVFTRDYVRFTMDTEPDAAEPVVIEEPDKELPSLSREVDFLARVQLGSDQILLLVEFQTRWTADMPKRMAAYCVRLFERYDEPVWPAVVVLRPGGALETQWTMEARGVTVAFCQFAVVPLWEVDAQRVVEQRLVGLYPLLPLMRRDNRGDRETLEWAQQLVLEQIPGREHRADAYVALRVLSGIAYPVSLVTDILRRTEMQLESPVYREILEEGREEGVRRTIVAMLTPRLGPPPDNLVARIEAVSDAAALDELVRRAAVAESWEALDVPC